MSKYSSPAIACIKTNCLLKSPFINFYTIAGDKAVFQLFIRCFEPLFDNSFFTAPKVAIPQNPELPGYFQLPI
jgi:hypothetical protein